MGIAISICKLSELLVSVMQSIAADRAVRRQHDAVPRRGHFEIRMWGAVKSIMASRGPVDRASAVKGTASGVQRSEDSACCRGR